MEDDKGMGKRGLVMIPYANLDKYESGVNFRLGDESERIALYLKNCCVACLSAAEHIESIDDVALVTNIDVPEPYVSLLREKNVKIINVPFDVFNFGESYSWSLAFYKLCALYRVCHDYDYDYDYDYYSYLDSDVYVQSSFANIWKECNEKILLYDINHGLVAAHYINLISEVQSFLPDKRNITHYGGEFFAASKDMARIFSESCLEVFDDMVRKECITTHGDEFIISIVADNIYASIKNAGAYIYRYWTARYRLVSTNYKYNPVVVLHVPAEKRQGMLRVFNYYLRHKKMPSNEQVWKMLHLDRRQLSVTIKMILSTMIFKRN